MTGNAVRNTKIILACLGVAIALGLLMFVVSHGRAKARLAAKKGALIAAGEILELKQLTPTLAPGKSNGGKALLSAINALPDIEYHLYSPSMRILGSGRALLSSSVKVLPNNEGAQWSTNIWFDLEPLIEPHRESMMNVARTLTNDAILFDPDYRNDGTPRLPHVVKMKGYTVWNAALIPYDLQRGDYVSAGNNLLAGSRLVAKWRHEPFIFSQLVRQMMLGILVKSLWEMLQYDHWSDAQWREIQDTWAAIDFWQGMEEALQMERVMSMPLFEQQWLEPGVRRDVKSIPALVADATGEALKRVFNKPGKGLKMLFVDVPQIATWPWITRYDDQLFYIDSVQHSLDALRIGMQSNSVMAARAAAGRKSFANVPPAYPLSRVMLYPTERVMNYTGEADAIRILGVTAIALKRYCGRYGKYPKGLKDLVPDFVTAIPIDAIDGAALRYRPDGNGRYVLWSIGTDGRDDGGDGMPPPGKHYWSQCPDLVWPWPAESGEVEAYVADLQNDLNAMMPLIVSPSSK